MTTPDGEKKNTLSICLALVHNNNQERNALIKPKIQALKETLQQTYSAENVEVSYQPMMMPHSTYRAFQRDVTYHLLEYQWRKYRFLPTSLFETGRALFRLLLRKYLTKRGQELQHWKQIGPLEMILSDKHIRVWDRFLESQANLLICFEDDTVFKKESLEKIQDVLKEIGDHNQQVPLYIDLAGGCSLSGLQLDQLEVRKKGFLRFYKKAVTNTTCTYCINRAMAEQFKALLVRNPSYRITSVDWMVNRLFITLDQQGVKTACFHTDPTLFKHGSTTGEFQAAWQR